MMPDNALANTTKDVKNLINTLAARTSMTHASAASNRTPAETLTSTSAWF